MNDAVKHPSHYTDGNIEVIDFIEDKKLGFHLGNTIKYICRAGKKDPEKTIEDLQKAEWYLHREIQRLEAKKQKDARAEELRAVGVTFADDIHREIQRLEAKKRKDARAEELRAVGVTFADDLRREVRTPEGVQV